MRLSQLPENSRTINIYGFGKVLKIVYGVIVIFYENFRPPLDPHSVESLNYSPLGPTTRPPFCLGKFHFIFPHPLLLFIYFLAAEFYFVGAERVFYNKFVTKIDLCTINDKRNETSYIFTILVKCFRARSSFREEGG